MEKFYAINWHKDEVWVEFGYYKNKSDAERFLARNNPQVILDSDEMKEVVKSVIRDFLDGDVIRIIDKERWYLSL